MIIINYSSTPHHNSILTEPQQHPKNTPRPKQHPCSVGRVVPCDDVVKVSATVSRGSDIALTTDHTTRRCCLHSSLPHSTVQIILRTAVHRGLLYPVPTLLVCQWFSTLEIILYLSFSIVLSPIHVLWYLLSSIFVLLLGVSTSLLPNTIIEGGCAPLLSC